MIRRFIDALRIRAAVRDHTTTHKHRVLEVMPTRTELDTIEAFRKLGAQTRFPTRLGQAAQLEAHDVPKDAVDAICRISGNGRLESTPEDRLHQAFRDSSRTSQILRLQNTVKRLARLAGPGFTTQHLIDDGLLEEGDI